VQNYSPRDSHKDSQDPYQVPPATNEDAIQAIKSIRRRAMKSAFWYLVLFVVVQIAVSIVTMLVLMNTNAGMFDMGLGSEQFTIQMTRLLEENIGWTLLASSAISVLIAWFIAKRKGMNPVAETLIKPISWKLALVSILMGIAYAVTYNSVMNLPWASFLGEAAQAQEFLFSSVLTMVVGTTIIPIAEELFFRGFILTELRRALPMWGAALLSSVFFGAIHGSLVWGISAFMIGMVLAWQALRTKSILVPILTHAAINGTSFFITPLMANDMETLSVLSFAGVAFVIGLVILFVRITSPMNEQETSGA
jgi:membrane protease YdiL (CAAX protease family)